MNERAGPDGPEPGRGRWGAGEGAHVVDAAGTGHLDFVLGRGARILGHNPAPVVEALRVQAERGASPSAAAGLEAELAARISAALPGVEVLEFSASEADAVTAAIRMARAVTGRGLILACGGAHPAGGPPPAAGPGSVAVPYNSVDAVAEIFARRSGEIAALVVEPVASLMGCVPPAPGYLRALRRITREHGALLVFDEAATGFRVAYGGAQTLLGVEPDLTCLGRVIGGGLPLAAWGGRRRLLERAAAIGAGTGGQVPGTGGRTGGAGTHGAGTRGARALPEMAPAMAAGIAVLDALREGGTYARLETLGSRLGDGLRTAAVAASVPCAVNRVGSMLTVFPGVERVDDAEGAGRCDLRGFTRLHRTWSDAGVIWPDSPFEAAFLSTAHQVADVDRAVSAFAGALRTRNAEPA